MLTFFLTDSNVVNRATICGLSAQAIKVFICGVIRRRAATASDPTPYPARRVDITNPANILDKALFEHPVEKSKNTVRSTYIQSRLKPRHTLPGGCLRKGCMLNETKDTAAFSSYYHYLWKVRNKGMLSSLKTWHFFLWSCCTYVNRAKSKEFDKLATEMRPGTCILVCFRAATRLVCRWKQER